jgi:hypothetical protein
MIPSTSVRLPSTRGIIVPSPCIRLDPTINCQPGTGPADARTHKASFLASVIGVQIPGEVEYASTGIYTQSSDELSPSTYLRAG